MTDKIELLLGEFENRREGSCGRSARESRASDTSEGDHDPRFGGLQLERSFASEYLDELIIAVLCRREEANGMEIIRGLTQRLGVQFSPGTVYPHLHALEEEGVLACRECVQTKEYRIDDWQGAEEYLRSTATQLSKLRTFLETSPRDTDQ